MNRTVYIPVILILAVLSIVVMVRAQDWTAWSDIAAASHTATPAGGANTQQAATILTDRLQTLHNEPAPNAEPARFQPQDAVGLPPRSRPSPASQTLLPRGNTYQFPPQASPQIVHNGFVVAQTQAETTQPLQLAQAEASAASNQGASIGQQSSRRAHTAPEAAPRVARRDERPTLPAAEARPPAGDATAAAGGVLFQSSAPVLSIKTSGPQTIAVGKSADYVIAINNGGSVDATDVAVAIEVPSWAEVVGTEATMGSARFEPIVDDRGRVKWSIIQLAAQSSQRLTLRLVPRESRSFNLAVAFTHKSQPQFAQIDVQEPKLELMLSGPQDVLYGETKTYSITVSNPGTGPAENVVLNLLPVAAGQDTTGVSELGVIEAGGRKVLEFELTARQAGQLELRVAAFADGGLRSEAAQRIQVRRAALETVVAGPQIKYAGTAATYQVRVANTGDALAENVVAETILPRSAKFVAASDGGVWDADQGRVQWPVGALRSGAHRVFQVQCILAEAGNNRLEAIASAAGDLTSAAHWLTKVEALADLKLLINDPQGPLPAGEPAVFEVRIINRGTKAAEGVQISAFFSDGVEPLSVEGAVAEIGVGQVIFQPIQRIVAGQELLLKITAKAATAGDHTFRTEVVCASPETKLSAQETTRFYGASIGQGQPTPADNVPTPAGLPPLDFDRRR